MAITEEKSLQDQLPPSQAAAMRAVQRAAAELRRGGFVLVEDDGHAVLAQAAETATADSLAALTRSCQGPVHLILTAARARGLNLAVAGEHPVALTLDDGVEVDLVRGLIDPIAPLQPYPPAGVARLDEGEAKPAAAAVELAKLAQLLPAALIADLPAGPIDRFVAKNDVLRVGASAITNYPELAVVTLRPIGEARVPLAVAEDARVVGFRPADGGIEQFAILIGDPAAHQPALCRLHSECFTGDLLGSLRCDCGPQLRDALRLMGEAGHGVLLYMAHEGRGIGLINKLRAYELQDRGFDTVEANRHLGFEPDERTYAAAAVMLRHLGIAQVRLLTNNPAKVRALTAQGIEVVDRVPHAVPANRHNRAYLATKAQKSGHLLQS